eukprot:1196231-Prorocentrum_minimum.AAC.3
MRIPAGLQSITSVPYAPTSFAPYALASFWHSSPPPVAKSLSLDGIPQCDSLTCPAKSGTAWRYLDGTRGSRQYCADLGGLLFRMDRGVFLPVLGREANLLQEGSRERGTVRHLGLRGLTGRADGKPLLSAKLPQSTSYRESNGTNQMCL